MSEQEPEVVERRDLKKYEKNLLNSAVSRELNGEEVGNLSNRGRVIREILSRGPQSVKDALSKEYMEIAKDCERGRTPDNIKRRKHPGKEKLLRGGSSPVIETVIVHNFL